MQSMFEQHSHHALRAPCRGCWPPFDAAAWPGKNFMRGEHEWGSLCSANCGEITSLSSCSLLHTRSPRPLQRLARRVGRHPVIRTCDVDLRDKVSHTLVQSRANSRSFNRSSGGELVLAGTSRLATSFCWPTDRGNDLWSSGSCRAAETINICVYILYKYMCR